MPDRPAPETEFLRRTPTVWQDTQVLAGTTERTVALARRSGDDWFVGAINGSDAHKLALALAFLDPGRAYLAHLHPGDPAALPAPRTVYSFRTVFSTDRLELSLAATGGAAIWLTPDSKRR
jgi:alpha-glucosidase